MEESEGRIKATNEDRVDGGALRIDSGKPRLDLIDPEFLRGIADAVEYGATKYQAWDWLKGWKWGRPYASILRHLYAWLRGEDYDMEPAMLMPERFPNGIHHLHMAGAQLMFLVHMVGRIQYKHLDDRPDFDGVEVSQ